ncbi:MAG: nuclear transport factor 2 family protein [Flavobacteriales bacterium]
MSVPDRFYSAFARKDWAEMGACYHPEARFSDPVFPQLDAVQVRAMWKMLLNNDAPMSVTFRVVEENEMNGVCDWEARYSFSTTGSPVHNIIHSEFEFRDGLIYRQRDRFDFWRWSRQALGSSGLFLGWTPIMRNKVRATAARRLAKAMQA